MHPKEIWRTLGVFIRIRKRFRRLNCSSVQAMLNQTAINDSKGESFPLDFNLKDVTPCHRSRNKPGKIYISKELVEVQICWQLVLCCSSSHAALCAVFMCNISISAYGNKEEWSVCYVRIQTSKGTFARYLSLLSFVLLYGKSLLFSWTRLNIGILPIFALGLF